MPHGSKALDCRKQGVRDMVNDRFNLEGKKAMVSGAGRGIGRAIALGLASCGADVAIMSRNIGELEEVAGKIKSLGRNAIPIKGDVSQIDKLPGFVNQVVDDFRRIDILVNVAGASLPGTSMDADEQAWDAMMNVNLKGLFFLSQAVARVMKEQGGGSIINITSAAGLRPGIRAVYSISKAGVIMATQAAAKEWGKYNIRVNAVAPGLVRTSLTEHVWDNPEIIQARLKSLPAGRAADADDIAGAVIFLASDASSYSYGAIIAVDGGDTL
jgi:NAD(P)-dependent dehydrogenase (short-subunit alcohol dehydrogenase family)